MALLGCTHYRRKLKFLAPCCGNIYTCRFCHDAVEDHELNRYDVTQIICSNCHSIQPVDRMCYCCHIQFGAYTCLKCRLFDDDLKGQFHCNDCGVCRVGGSENYFHCKTCNYCLNISLVGNHKCIENGSRTSCPVCIEDIHTSRNEFFPLDCGHVLHNTCLEQLWGSEHRECPICKTSFSAMTRTMAFIVSLEK